MNDNAKHKSKLLFGPLLFLFFYRAILYLLDCYYSYYYCCLPRWTVIISKARIKKNGGNIACDIKMLKCWQRSMYQLIRFFCTKNLIWIIDRIRFIYALAFCHRLGSIFALILLLKQSNEFWYELTGCGQKGNCFIKQIWTTSCGGEDILSKKKKTINQPTQGRSRASVWSKCAGLPSQLKTILEMFS